MTTNFKKITIGLILISTVIALFSCSPKYKSGEDVIKAMYTKWENKWYRNFAFEQTVLHFKNDTVTGKEVWQEIMRCPGDLHIRFNGFESGDGMLFRNDSLYKYKDSVLVSSVKYTHYLLLIGFDVYFQDPKITAEKITAQGFDLSKCYQTVEEGNNYIVVGAKDKTDSLSSQFWVDAKNLYVTRVIKNNNPGIRQVDLENYQWFKEYPVAMRIVFKNEGKITMTEEYFNVTFPETVGDDKFTPSNFTQIRW